MSTESNFKDLCVTEIALAFEAECVSEEGARFVRNAFRACETALQDFRRQRLADLKWCVNIINAVDYAGWNDEKTS